MVSKVEEGHNYNEEMILKEQAAFSGLECPRIITNRKFFRTTFSIRLHSIIGEEEGEGEGERCYNI